MRVIVIGGGIIGTLSAYYLQRQGAEVTLLEKADEVAAGTSGMNAGQLSYSYVSPLGSPAIWGLIGKMLRGGMEDVKVTKWIDPQLWSFGLRLLAQSSQKKYDGNQRNLLALALESRDLMAAFRQEHKLDFDYHQNGKLHLFVTEAQRETARIFSKTLEKIGIRQEVLSPEECVARAPSLRNRTGPLAGGLLSHADETGDCKMFARGVKNILGTKILCRTGVEVRRITISGNSVTGVETTAGEIIPADKVLICAGADAHALLNKVGIRVPLYPVKGYSATLPLGDLELQHSVTDHYRRVVFAPLGDRLRVSGFIHFSGNDRTIAPGTTAHFHRILHDVFPQVAISNLDMESGLRPYLPTSTPYVGKTKIDGLCLNIGHAMLGWTLAHATAKRAADITLPRL